MDVGPVLAALVDDGRGVGEARERVDVRVGVVAFEVAMLEP